MHFEFLLTSDVARLVLVCIVILLNNVVIGLRRRSEHGMERLGWHAPSNQNTLRGRGEKPEVVHRRTLTRGCPRYSRLCKTGIRGQHPHRGVVHHRQPKVLR